MNSENMKDLAKISDGQFQDFINSFDSIVADIDGTVIYGDSVIPGADEFILKMRKLRKTITFVTNNGMCSLELVMKKLKPFRTEINEIITPFVSLSNYLRSINFDKELYAICGDMDRESFKSEGFKVVEFEDLNFDQSNSPYAEDLYHSSARLKDRIKNIGAVVTSGGIHSSWQKAQAAIDILNGNKDAIWICGGIDDSGSIGQNLIAIGLKCIIEAIALHTSRKPKVLAKPSAELVEPIKLINNFKDPERVLVIGDSIAADMGLGANCGFQKLLVLSGTAKNDDLADWKYPEEYKPEYYADNLGLLNFRLNKMVYS